MGVRIVVVDHRPLFSRCLELLLPEVGDGMQVVGHTDAAAGAAALVRRHLPDLVLVDLGLGPPGALHAVAAIRRAEPRVPVLALLDGPATDDERPARDAVAAGARGVLVRTERPEDLVAPLRAAAAGWAVLPAPLLAQLTPAAPPAQRLDPDQERLWLLVSAGTSTRRIAEEMHVSERTVKRLTAALLRRLGVASRTEAAALAGRVGLIP